MGNNIRYKRISIKLSGEALAGKNDVLDFNAVGAIARQLKLLHESGVEVGVTVGAGNIWRGRSSGAMERNRADQMGMLATIINSLALQDALEKINVPSVVMSSTDVPRFCESYTSRGALAALNEGKLVIFAAGSGLPFFSTDTAAALKAAEIHADALLLAKNVDGVYSCDPNSDKSAVRYDTLTYKEVVENELRATDLTAITLCMEQNIPILVFSMKEEGSILRVVRGEKVGTIIQ